MNEKSFLKWVGGKRKISKDITSIFPRFNNYYEPFLGGGSVFLELGERCKGLHYLSDINRDLIDTWNEVKNYPERLLSDLKSFPSIWDKEIYYKIRSNEESPARMVYLNRMCYNGLYRKNKSGKFNVPIGSEREFKIPEDAIVSTHKYMIGKKVTIECCDYLSILDKTSSGDLVYLDPPYCSSFNNYVGTGFCQSKLADFCKQLDEKGVYFVLSNKQTDNIMNLYKDFSIKKLDVFHSVGRNASSRKKVHEVLVHNVSKLI